MPQIIDALKVLDADPSIEVIIIARGGGGIEDLLPFSDEALCRAVFGCRTPVVSAIGHETDAPLIDYVADVRASTPTDAAKRVVPDLTEEVRLIGQARHRLERAVRNLVDRESHRLDGLRSRPVLARPQVMVEQRATELTALRQRAGRCLDHRLAAADNELRHTLARLRALPAATLDRGTRSCSAPTATWCARRPRSARATRCGSGWPTVSWPPRWTAERRGAVTRGAMC
ncbi:hypothetical protein GCM10027614_38230 [Micromonospora vulcania]